MKLAQLLNILIGLISGYYYQFQVSSISHSGDIARRSTSPIPWDFQRSPAQVEINKNLFLDCVRSLISQECTLRRKLYMRKEKTFWNFFYVIKFYAYVIQSWLLLFTRGYLHTEFEVSSAYPELWSTGKKRSPPYKAQS